ncbi:hypothetical protein BJF82_14235, partial [Kytococcus sp. CUA-901]
MAEQLDALRLLAADPRAGHGGQRPARLGDSGATLDRTMSAFWVARSADTNPERDAIMAEFAPRLAAHSDTIMLDPDLYARLRALRERADAGEVELDEQDEFVLDERLRGYERGGITLDEPGQARLRELNAELATLSTEFDRLLVTGRAAAAVHVTDEAQLAGLGADETAGLREAAQAAGLDGWLVTLTNTTGQPVLDSLEDRSLRERVFRASVERGLSEGEHDTRDILVRIARLRAERATLLGYEHHASYVHQVGCARTTAAVNDLLARLAPGVVELAEREADALAEQLRTLDPDATLEAWDWQFLAARDSGDAFDTARLTPYLEFEQVLTEGVFAAATALYGITFHEREDLVGYTKDARVFEVREEDGTTLGLVVLDPYTRPTKKGGAWMTSIVDQSHLLGDLPVVTNTCNLPPPAPGSPSPHDVDQRHHALPRVRARPARAALRRALPLPLGHLGPARLVEFPSQV